MPGDIVTRIDREHPRLAIEYVNGRLVRCQAGRLTSVEPDAAVAAIRQALTDGLRRHRGDVMATLVPLAADPTDPDQAEVMAFVQEQLQRAQGARPAPQPGWYAGLADGRDAGFGVHVTIAESEVVLLEISADLLSDGRALERAVVEAVNQALDRIGHDYAELTGEIVLPAQPEPFDWPALAEHVRRLRRGY